MAMPKKHPTLKRSEKVIAYLQPSTHEAFQRRAEEQGRSVSALASELIERFIFSETNHNRRDNVDAQLVHLVLGLLAEQGLLSDNISSDKLSPSSIPVGDELSPTTFDLTPQANEVTFVRTNENRSYAIPQMRRRAVIGRRDDNKN